MKTMNINLSKIHKSKAMALILSSVILVSMLFLTLAAINTSVSHRLIMSSEQSLQQSKVAAEAAMRVAQEDLLQVDKSSINSNNANTDCQGNSCSQNTVQSLLSGVQSVVNSGVNLVEVTTKCTNGLCVQDTGKGIWKNADNWINAQNVGSVLKNKAKLVETPKFLVEYIGEKKNIESVSVGAGYEESEDYTSSPIYRVTGKAKGKHGEKETIIQSTFH